MTTRPIRGIALAALCIWALLPWSVRAEEREALQHYKKGLEFVQQEKWDDAIRELNEATLAKPRSGTLRIGMFREKYFPYYYLGRAFLGKGSHPTAVTYFNREEAEGQIQQLDKELYQRLMAERKRAGGTAPPPGAVPGPVPVPTQAPGPRQGPVPVPTQAPGPTPGPAPGPVRPQDIEKARDDCRKELEKIKTFDGRHAAALSPEEREKLTALNQSLTDAISTNDGERLTTVKRVADRELASLLVGMADSLAKTRRAFMSQTREKEMREQSARLKYAIEGDDRELVDKLSTDLGDRIAQARDQIEQAFSAVRTAFESSEAGGNDQAVQGLETAVASQPDSPALRLILARFYFNIALSDQQNGEPKMTRAREEAAQAFKLRSNLSIPQRYFPPGFLELVKQARKPS
jgi:tetratricopeptide (TPR) repeat protein